MSDSRLFIGVYPAGICYSDKSREEHGDYARVGFLSYKTLEPQIERNCPPELRQEIEEHMASMQAKRGQLFEISNCGQTVMLG